MSNLLKSFLAIGAVFLTSLGLMSVFGVISDDHLSSMAGKIMLGLGVLLACAVVLKLLGSSSGGGSSGSEPPPIL